jgi:hypothetical protein
MNSASGGITFCGNGTVRVVPRRPGIVHRQPINVHFALL